MMSFSYRTPYHASVLLIGMSLQLLLVAGCTSTVDAQSLVDLVDPLIGTAPSTTPSAVRHSHAGNEPKGQTFPAVGLPFGMTHWTPQTRSYETKCISPYYYDDRGFQGIRGSHWWSGSCTQDYGSFTVMPVLGSLHIDRNRRAVTYSHENEQSGPDYYRLELPERGLVVELTGTNRSGFVRLTFSRSDSLHIVIEPNSDEGFGTVSVNTDSRQISGSNPVHRIYQGWGQPAGFSGHLSAVFKRDFDWYGVAANNLPSYTATSVQANDDSVSTAAFAGFFV